MDRTNLAWCPPWKPNLETEIQGWELSPSPPTPDVARRASSSFSESPPRFPNMHLSHPHFLGSPSWVEAMRLMRRGSAQICLMTRKADSWILTALVAQRCTCFVLFSHLPQSSRNCPQNPVWMPRRQGSLANQGCWFLCLRLRTSVFPRSAVACGTLCSFWNLASSQNRDSLFTEGKSCLFVSALDARKEKEKKKEINCLPIWLVFGQKISIFLSPHPPLGVNLFCRGSEMKRCVFSYNLWPFYSWHLGSPISGHFSSLSEIDFTFTAISFNDFERIQLIFEGRGRLF